MRRTCARITFAFFLLLASGASAQVTPYEWVLQTGPNNILDSNPTSCDNSQFNVPANSWFAPGEGCYNRTGAPCRNDPSHTCNLQIVPRTRCTNGDLSASGGPGSSNTCVWPHGAGRCGSNTHVGCLTDAYVANPAVTASGPSAMCTGTGGSTCDMATDPYGGPFRSDCACDPNDPVNERAVCGMFAGTALCSDGDPERDSGGFGLALGLEAKILTVVAFPGLGPAVTGASTPSTSPRYPLENPPAFYDLQRDPGSIGRPFAPTAVHRVRTTDARQETVFNGTLDIHKLRGFGDSFWADWSYESGAVGGLNTHTAFVSCNVPPGWQPGTLVDPTPGSPNSGDERYCHQLASDSLQFVWRRDLTPVELANNPNCPPNCKKDFDLTTVENEAFLAAAGSDRNAGVQLAIQSGEGRQAGASDVLGVTPVNLVLLLSSGDGRCRLGGWGNPLEFVGRCADGPSGCIPGDPVNGDSLCNALGQGGSCRVCNGPLNPANPLGLPIGYNTHGLTELDLVAGQRVGVLAGIAAQSVTPLFLVGTTGYAAADFRDKPNEGSADDIANLGEVAAAAPFAPGIGVGGTFLTNSSLPIGELCCANGNVTWGPAQLGTPVTSFQRTFDAGPGADGIPGCVGDNLFGSPSGACDQRLGRGNPGAKTDGFFATGKDDVAQTFAVGASMIPASQSRYGAHFVGPPPQLSAFNLVSAVAFRDSFYLAGAKNLDGLIKLDVSHCPIVSGTPECFHAGDCQPGSDPDGDGVCAPIDDCPTIANPGSPQSDFDNDGVGDICDNCVFVTNPRPTAPDFLVNRPWATLTGGQRDDDQDGWGNVCDGDFPGTAQSGNVNAADLAQFRASNGHSRDALNCGTTANRRCAIYDIDLNANSPSAPPPGNVNAADLARFRLLNGTPASVPTNKCPTCPLGCTSGTAGACP